ncbi:peptidoglycan DD-metalloendopeptidase family protein [Parapedobacter deserti]|uniref:Peptidoglycan DD-metalloendopeptidase family protein n=1 Tax=Parapedobacter deserti TaxID=1912957 RepID=A0ABV7JLX5_9SPHI
MKRFFRNIGYVMISTGALASCSDQFTGTLFKRQYPHQRYQKQLDDAGLEHSALYRQWVQAATRSLNDPVAITIPHRELAYLAGDKPTAIGYAFGAREGELLHVDVTAQGTDSVQLFIDLFEAPQDTANAHRHLVSADTGATYLTWDVPRDGQYILRIQPELLAEVSLDLTLTAEPSLANPVAPSAKQHIGSVFGDARDGGSRKHEGIDIFAARHTPVVAAADGVVARVGDNRLGGKVVWLRPKGRQINLYYAHLDSQLVFSGQPVRTGDTLGLMGNTGNARTTPPHLHFGIYRSGGAVDPLPFVRPGKSNPPKITADTSRIGDTMRTTAQLTAGIPRHSPVSVEAAYMNGYRVVFPDHSKRFLTHKQLVPLAAIRRMQLARERTLYAQPDTSAARVTELTAGERTSVIAEYNGFLLVESPHRGWIMR